MIKDKKRIIDDIEEHKITPKDLVITDRPNIIRRLENKSQSEFVKGTNIEYDRFKKVDEQVNGINIKDTLEIAKHYDCSVDYIYGISEYKNEEYSFYYNLLKNIDRIEKKEDYIYLNISHFFIEFLRNIKGLEEDAEFDDYTKFEKDYRTQEFIEDYKHSIDDTKNLKDDYILISVDKFNELTGKKDNKKNID